MLRVYGDGKIFGESYGDGPIRVLWLHGWARSSADFSAAATLLAREGVASVALDLPGFGASPLPSTTGGSALYARLIEPVVAELGQPLVLVGHSNGGRVATVLAATQPDRVKGLVLSGAPLLRLEPARRPKVTYRVVRQLHRRHMISDARMEAARRRYGSSDYRNATGHLRDILVASVNESFESELEQIVAPVALVWGDNDREVPPEVARRARALLTHSSEVELEVLAATGHLVPLERPDVLCAHVRRLVARA